MCVFLHVFLAASSGTVTINADSTVQILVEDAYPLDMFDAQVCNNNIIMLCTVYNYTVYSNEITCNMGSSHNCTSPLSFYI